MKKIAIVFSIALALGIATSVFADNKTSKKIGKLNNCHFYKIPDYVVDTKGVFRENPFGLYENPTITYAMKQVEYPLQLLYEIALTGNSDALFMMGKYVTEDDGWRYFWLKKAVDANNIAATENFYSKSLSKFTGITEYEEREKKNNQLMGHTILKLMKSADLKPIFKDILLNNYQFEFKHFKGAYPDESIFTKTEEDLCKSGNIFACYCRFGCPKDFDYFAASNAGSPEATFELARRYACAQNREACNPDKEKAKEFVSKGIRQQKKLFDKMYPNLPITQSDSPEWHYYLWATHNAYMTLNKHDRIYWLEQIVNNEKDIPLKVDAYFALAQIYDPMSGLSVAESPDAEKTIKYLKKMCGLGSVKNKYECSKERIITEYSSIYAVGKSKLFWGKKFQKDYNKYIYWRKIATLQGEAAAYESLFSPVYDGFIGDDKEAYEYWRKRCLADEAALYRLVNKEMPETTLKENINNIFDAFGRLREYSDRKWAKKCTYLKSVYNDVKKNYKNNNCLDLYSAAMFIKNNYNENEQHIARKIFLKSFEKGFVYAAQYADGQVSIDGIQMDVKNIFVPVKNSYGDEMPYVKDLMDDSKLTDCFDVYNSRRREVPFNINDFPVR